jgi:hypothetical protein
VDLVAALGGSDCERIRSGVLAQPSNAVSSLAYVAAAAVVVATARRATGPRRLVLFGYAGALVTVGTGSVAYHGPQPAWAGWAHDGSIAVMLMLAAVVLVGAEPVRQWRSPARKLLATSALLAASAYLAGRTGSPLCAPDSFVQPHAAWHVLSALSPRCCQEWARGRTGVAPKAVPQWRSC